MYIIIWIILCTCMCIPSAATVKVPYAYVSDIISAYPLRYLEIHTGSHSHIHLKQNTKHSKSACECTQTIVKPSHSEL